MESTVVDIVGYIAAGLVFCSFYMRTMKKLRIIAIVGNAFSLIYALSTGSTPIVLLQLSLLPLNILRLRQFQEMLNKMETASQDSYDYSPLIPYMKTERLCAGSPIFQQGDRADKFYIVKSGKVAVMGVDGELGEGDVLGEIGIFSSDHKRTATATANTDTQLYSITDETIRQLHYQNPDFSLYLVRLIIKRMQENIHTKSRYVA